MAKIPTCLSSIVKLDDDAESRRAACVARAPTAAPTAKALMLAEDRMHEFDKRCRFSVVRSERLNAHTHSELTRGEFGKCWARPQRQEPE